jgi:hypothetical protein
MSKNLAGLQHILIVSDRLASQSLLERPTMLPIEKNWFNLQINCNFLTAN